MQTIKFIKNWNSKLCCDYFTTIRLESKKYKVGEIYDIELTLRPGKIIKQQVQCVHIENLKLANIPESTFYNDCGMSKEKAMKMMETMYSKYIVNVHEATWSVIVLKHYYQN